MAPKVAIAVVSRMILFLSFVGFFIWEMVSRIRSVKIVIPE